MIGLSRFCDSVFILFSGLHVNIKSMSRFLKRIEFNSWSFEEWSFEKVSANLKRLRNFYLLFLFSNVVFFAYYLDASVSLIPLLSAFLLVLYSNWIRDKPLPKWKMYPLMSCHVVAFAYLAQIVLISIISFCMFLVLLHASVVKYKEKDEEQKSLEEGSFRMKEPIESFREKTSQIKAKYGIL